jgi:phosphoserine aminotransferase
LTVLSEALVGRSHRSPAGRSRLRQTIDLTREILQIPDEYLVGIMPASDTGAFEAALWNLVGPKKVTVLVWESFGQDWAVDITRQLMVPAEVRCAPYGELPDLQALDWSGDVVFVANGTTSGVKVPDWEWIPQNRQGLAFCDATSAAFAMPLDWEKLDVVTFSWQKCLGGEAAHGMLVMGPRARERMEAYDPPWPIPKIFRIKKSGKLDQAIFAGDTINTPSMLCVEDYLDALKWAKNHGLAGLIAKTKANLALVEAWVERTPWVEFLVRDARIRSSTSVCLSVDLSRGGLDGQERLAEVLKEVTNELSRREIGHDIHSYRDAPLGLRIWCGPTVEAEDIEKLLAELEIMVLSRCGAEKREKAG